ncbi:MAG TPA: hypothetical protein VF582_04945 [Allosphingosinicella sp.]|jgi:hypothetical protein
MDSSAPEAGDRLYLRALEIRYGNKPGLWLPKILALAVRGHSDAMIELADWLSEGPDKIRSPTDRSSAAGLYFRAYRKGNARAAHSFAMDFFNAGDLKGYRGWLRRAANAGDQSAGLQLARFETRLPHANAARSRRLRPEHRREEFY